jgi:hypothetical protein
MKKIILIGITLLVAIYLFIANSPKKIESGEVVQLTDLPWQIEIDSNGGSTVFGQKLGISKLREFQQKVKSDPKIRLFRDPDNSLSVEAFFKKITLARITSKVAIKLQLSGSKLSEFEARAIKKKVTPTGNYELELPHADEEELLDAKIAVISWSPTWLRLDDEMVTERFGDPGEIIKADDLVQHWLYPKLGLDIIRKPRNKVTLHYISPNRFRTVREELIAQQNKKAGD